MTRRQDSIRALASFRRLPDHEQSALLKTKAAINRRVLTRNMHAYFEGCLIDEGGVMPAFNWSEFTDSMADALQEIGKSYGLGTVLLQALVLELQDRLEQPPRV